MSQASDVTADPLVPRHGDPAYDVSHYDLDLTWKPAGNHLTARAVLDVVVVTPGERLVLDLHVLRVSKVTIQGAELRQWRHTSGRIVLRLARPVAPGARLRVTVAYAGVPRTVPGPDGDAGWEELEDGLIVASQPHGAPSWFPCNDRASDKATYRLGVTVPSDYTVVANGVLLERTPRHSRTTWVWQERHPMATYLATLQIGRYAVTTLTAPDATVPVTVAHPARHAQAVGRAFGRQVEMLEVFTRLFGPYPFDGYAVVVTDDVLEIPLESQGLSTFGSTLARTDWGAQRLIAHELSHQWFGNSATLTHWRDIWLHEGFACYSEWIWSQESGGESTHTQAVRHHGRLTSEPQDLVIADPGADELFDDRVYKRGALTLHALRLTIGDDAFFGLLRRWLVDHRYGSVTTTEFISLATLVSGADVGPLLASWLYDAPLPALPPLP
ncbi:M1 family metallopeptidase [Dermatophilaceae bacterium Soc4.6]